MSEHQPFTTAPGLPRQAVPGSQWAAITKQTFTELNGYVSSLRQVASGANPETALPVLLMAVAQVNLTGARLGAMADVIPSQRFEPDFGPDPDIDPLRTTLLNVLEGLDEYLDVVDPFTSTDVVTGSLVNDLTDIAACISHGTVHYRNACFDEALWWWQFSYVSAWGDRAASALRVLQSLLSHVRLDTDEETVADAEFEALHTTRSVNQEQAPSRSPGSER